jgi:hypothetical protein
MAFGAFKACESDDRGGTTGAEASTDYTGAKLGFTGYAYGALSTTAVGGAAAAASWGIVRALDSQQPA